MVGLRHCCPARILLYIAHDIDSTTEETFANVIHRSGANAVRHQPTVIEGLMQAIPWGSFDRLVADRGADDRSRGFNCRDHLTAMIGAALGGLNGLRQTVAGLLPGRGPLHLMGRKPPRRSTLADANSQRDPGLFFDLFMTMLPILGRTERRDMREAVRLIDSTQVNLGLRMRKWVGLHRGEPTAKIHVVYDPRAGQPVYFALTPAKVSDIAAARRMLPIEPGATYVFDLGYYDFSWFAKLVDNNCIFVTRLKCYTKLHDLTHRSVERGGPILSDTTGRLPKRLAASRRNPFQAVGREIVVSIDAKRSLRLFTNDLGSPAESIADLYKERWQIELFFKWIKQNLRIDRFMGTSENAVRIQIATALIAYLLIRHAQAKLAIGHRAPIILAVVRGQLFTRRTLAELLNPPPIRRPPQNPQLSLFPVTRYLAAPHHSPLP
jgi:hypothetical protein